MQEAEEIYLLRPQTKDKLRRGSMVQVGMGRIQ
jgi:hypothetical protein